MTIAPTPTPRRRRRTRFGGALVASLLPAAVAFAVHPAGAAPDFEQAKVAATGYYTSPVNDALPPVLTSEVPPGVVCIVTGIAGASQVCGDQVQQLKALLSGTPLDVSDGLPLPESADPQLPQPVAPGTLPVGLLGGKQRYASYLKIELPDVPAEHEVARFDLVLHQAPNAVNFAFESPAFRRAVLSALAAYEEKGPEPFQEFFELLVSQELEPFTQMPTGIEACAITEPAKAGAQSDGAIPASDCILHGATGVYDADAGTWTFDMSLAMGAWAGGTPNHGIYLHPVGAENVAYGDPDPSTNFVVSLADGSADPALLPKFNLSTFEVPSYSPPPFVGGVDTTPPSAGGISPNVNPFVGDDVLDSPPVAGGDVAAPEPSAEVAGPVELASASRGSAWYVWLALPALVVLAYVLTGAASGPPAAAQQRRGALTRLIEVRASSPEA